MAGLVPAIPTMERSMDDLILPDQEGGTARLTTDTPASSYGIPVLVIDADDIKAELGPADIVPSSPPITAADIVITWDSQPDRNEEERAAADRYLRQWPDGPQL